MIGSSQLLVKLHEVAGWRNEESGVQARTIPQITKSWEEPYDFRLTIARMAYFGITESN